MHTRHSITHTVKTSQRMTFPSGIVQACAKRHSVSRLDHVATEAQGG
jgi:hypothetical protein